MTLYAVQKFLYELNRTPALQTAYEEDRHAVLEPFDLTEEETSALLSPISASCFTSVSTVRSSCTLLRFTRSNGRTTSSACATELRITALCERVCMQ